MASNTLTLYRPWWQRAAHSLREAWTQWREERAARRAVEAALGMDEDTLRDIGAPLWLLEEARHRREQARFDRTLNRIHDAADRQRYV
jgi:hypothetical protein